MKDNELEGQNNPDRKEIFEPIDEQEILWREVDKVFNVKWSYGMPEDVLNELKEKFTITRKP